MENQITTSTDSKPPKKNAWFGKIETKEEALKVIKDSSNGFYFLAALQIVIGYFLLGLPAIIDGVIFAVLAFLLRKFNSMVVAVLLLLLSVGAVVVTAINQFGGGTGGRNTILAVIMIWTSIRAVQATFKLHKLEKSL
ncbi:MAG: hypothetical protein WCK91_02355 [bacterium]